MRSPVHSFARLAPLPEGVEAKNETSLLRRRSPVPPIGFGRMIWESGGRKVSRFASLALGGREGRISSSKRATGSFARIPNDVEYGRELPSGAGSEDEEKDGVK